MREQLERLAQVAAELGAARALVAQKEAELRQLLDTFAKANQLEPLHPLPPEVRLRQPLTRERHGEMVPKLILAMKTDMLAGNAVTFDARRIAHIMGCSEQTAAIRLKRACDRGHLKRVGPGNYALREPAVEPAHEEPLP